MKRPTDNLQSNHKPVTTLKRCNRKPCLNIDRKYFLIGKNNIALKWLWNWLGMSMNVPTGFSVTLLEFCNRLSVYFEESKGPMK